MRVATVEEVAIYFTRRRIEPQPYNAFYEVERADGILQHLYAPRGVGIFVPEAFEIKRSWCPTAAGSGFRDVTPA